jgi:hypothetical protein
MSSWDDFAFEMERLPLDTNTADRLVAGLVLPEDAPPGYSGVASLLAAARSSPTEPPPSRDALTMQRFIAEARSSRIETSTLPRRSSVHRIKLVAAVATAALACTTGLALAGSLPGAAQDVASSMLAKAGITVPGPNEHAGTHPSVRGTSSPDVADAAQRKPGHVATNVEANGQGKGSEVSQLATTTDLTGVEKGAAISTLASGGKSQAGQHGDATAEHGSSSSEDGAATADAASGGHSSAGAGNSSGGQSHRP